MEKLSAQQAATGRQVSIELTVTYIDPVWRFLFGFNEGDAGIKGQSIFVHGLTNLKVARGQKIRVTGITGKGDTLDGLCDGLPVIHAKSSEILGEGTLPAPKFVNDLSDVAFGSELDCESITTEVKLVHAVAQEPVTVFLAQTKSGGNFFIRIAKTNFPLNQAFLFVGDTVKVTGSLGMLLDVPAFHLPGDEINGARITAHQVFVQNLDQIERNSKDGQKSLLPVEPVSKIGDLANETVFKVDGQISFVGDKFFVLHDESGGARFLSKSTIQLNPGKLVRAVVQKDSKGKVHAKAIKVLNSLPLSSPVPMSFKDAIVKDNLYRRISLSGILKSVTKKDCHWMLNLESEGSPVEALFYSNGDIEMNSIELSTVKNITVTGIRVPAGSDRSVRLYLQNVADITVQSRKTPWSLYVARFILPILILGTLSLVLINRFLRARVSRQTAEISNVNARLLATYEAVDHGLMISDNRGKIATTNRKLMKLVGEKVEFQQDWQTFFSTIKSKVEDKNRIDEHIRAIKDNPYLVDRFDISFLDSGKFLAITSTPVFENEAEKPSGRVWVLMDMTRKRQLESSLVQAQKMEAIGSLAGGIAHDFNNLLTAIRLNLTLLKDPANLSSGKAATRIEAAEQATFRGAKLIKQMLSFSSENAYQKEPCSLNDCIIELKQLLDRAFDASIQFEFDLQEDLPDIFADSNLIEQMILNLLVNAKDAMPKGGKIWVRTSCKNNPFCEGDSFVELSIRDNGNGIPESIRQKIFDPFFSTKKESGGTGLGLAMVLSTVEQHDGQIVCSSQSDKGTEFTINLPVCDKSQRNNRLASTVSATGGNCGRILVIDDDPMVREVAKATLAHAGFEPYVANDGKHGLEILAEKQPFFDGVLLDLTMPEISGLDVIEVASEKWPNLPIVLCSGYFFEWKNELEQAKFANYSQLQKPYTLAELVQALNNAIEKSNKPRRKQKLSKLARPVGT